MSNLFSKNPWKKNKPSGPVYGNAYEDDPSPVNAYGNQDYNASIPSYQNNTSTYSSANNNYGQQANAWESNKTEYPMSDTNSAWGGSISSPITHTPVQQPMVQAQDAYQYSGTPYGNQPPPSKLQPQHLEQARNTSTSMVGPISNSEREYRRPTKWRFGYRLLTMITSIGHFGFAAGARPYSGEDIPFYTPACFYYLFAVAILSIIWSGLHVFHFCYRRMLKTEKFNRPIMFALDLLMVILWGVGIIVEMAKFHCAPGTKFCDFYNVSIFWGFTTFVLYIIGTTWDVLGACSFKRSK